MRRMMTMAAVLTFAGGALMTAGATNAEAAGTYEGCPAGYVCVYPGAGWNGGNPSLKYYTYGAHNLSNQYGVHRVFNNQTGGATLQLCTQYNGGNPVFEVNSFTYTDYDLTPINSLLLEP